MNFNYGFGTDIGRKRQQNQDRGAAFPQMGLFIVADGMGGHRGGETASAMAIELIPSIVHNHQKKLNWDAKVAVVEGIRAANRGIYDRALKQPALQGMGTTTTSLLFAHGTLTIGHVGDSRCYYLRPQGIWQVTRDHSLVQEKLRAGLITRDQLKTDRMKNVITRSVGFDMDVNVETYEMEVHPGDVFVICSDGLSGMIEDQEIYSAVRENLFEKKDIQKTTDALIEAANGHGGDDNVTVIVIQILDTPTAEIPTPTGSSTSEHQPG